MADEKSGLFTKKATDKLRSPDDLDEYVRVTNPSVWVVLVACVVLMVGLLVWGFLGTAETSVGALGTRTGGEVVCFLPTDKVANVHVGNTADVEGESMEVTSVSGVPVSRIEAYDIVGSDYLASTLVGGDWAYVVRLDAGGKTSLAEGVPLSVTITTERIAPISLLFKDGAHD